MSVFGTYARYYDLFYGEKDYEAEAAYVSSLVQKFTPGATSLLDLGCGTGRYTELFSRMGYKAVGMDRSEDMISMARQRNLNIQFDCGDICSFDLNTKYDVVVALFHVMSYLTTDHDLRQAFKHIKKHLEPGGLLVFDCWHGPAVLSTLPEVRVKRVQQGDTRLVRVAEPSMIAEENRVDVNFQVFVKENGTWGEFSETHSIRYLFQLEIIELLSNNRMQLLHAEEWLNAENPSKDTWNVVYVCQLL